MCTWFVTGRNLPLERPTVAIAVMSSFNKCQIFFIVFHVDLAVNCLLGCIQSNNYVFIDRLLRSANYYLGKDITDKFSALKIDNKCAELNNKSPSKGYAPNAVKITSK